VQNLREASREFVVVVAGTHDWIPSCVAVMVICPVRRCSSVGRRPGGGDVIIRRPPVTGGVR
jgi:NCAIR mutase (PurE)-related protein